MRTKGKETEWSQEQEGTLQEMGSFLVTGHRFHTYHTRSNGHSNRYSHFRMWKLPGDLQGLFTLYFVAFYCNFKYDAQRDVSANKPLRDQNKYRNGQMKSWYSILLKRMNAPTNSAAPKGRREHRRRVHDYRTVSWLRKTTSQHLTKSKTALRKVVRNIFMNANAQRL